MAARIRGWLARQSLTVKLLLAVPVLLVALFWSALPGGDARSTDPQAAGNRPVLTALGTPSALVTPTIQAGQATADRPLLAHEEPRPADTSLSWPTVLRTLVSIAVVVVLILLSGQGLKYVMAGAAQPLRAGATSLRVVETLHLPSPSGRGRSAIHLIAVGDQHLLVGATDAQLSLLTELPDDDASRLRRASAGQAVTPPGTSGTFAETLAAADGPARTTAATNGAPNGAHRNGNHQNGAPKVTEADLAQLLLRLRESKQRLEAGG